jgi:hypothetical protein
LARRFEFCFFHCEKSRVKSGLSRITECGTIVALKSSIESAGRRREGGEVMMDKISLFLLIGLVGWWIGNMAGQDQYAQILGTEASAVEMIMGIVGATVSCHLFLYPSSTR